MCTNVIWIWITFAFTFFSTFVFCFSLNFDGMVRCIGFGGVIESMRASPTKVQNEIIFSSAVRGDNFSVSIFKFNMPAPRSADPRFSLNQCRRTTFEVETTGMEIKSIMQGVVIAHLWMRASADERQQNSTSDAASVGRTVKHHERHAITKNSFLAAACRRIAAARPVFVFSLNTFIAAQYFSTIFWRAACELLLMQRRISWRFLVLRHSWCILTACECAWTLFGRFDDDERMLCVWLVRNDEETEQRN